VKTTINKRLNAPILVLVIFISFGLFQRS